MRCPAVSPLIATGLLAVVAIAGAARLTNAGDHFGHGYGPGCTSGGCGQGACGHGHCGHGRCHHGHCGHGHCGKHCGHCGHCKPCGTPVGGPCNYGKTGGLHEDCKYNAWEKRYFLRSQGKSWHSGWYDPAEGRPIALVVPPTSEFMTQYSWGVQFGVNAVRGPWGAY